MVFLSVALMFFSIPHTLEDFAAGEPAEAGVPAAVLSVVVATVIALQALGLYWIGRRQRQGLVAHLAVGLFWPVAAGVAQLPTILGGDQYRSGFISVLFVGGILVVGTMLFVATLFAMRKGSPA